jgi:hypothetical protein
MCATAVVQSATVAMNVMAMDVMGGGSRLAATPDAWGFAAHSDFQSCDPLKIQEALSLHPRLPISSVQQDQSSLRRVPSENSEVVSLKPLSESSVLRSISYIAQI